MHGGKQNYVRLTDVLLAVRSPRDVPIFLSNCHRLKSTKLVVASRKGRMSWLSSFTVKYITRPHHRTPSPRRRDNIDPSWHILRSLIWAMLWEYHPFTVSVDPRFDSRLWVSLQASRQRPQLATVIPVFPSTHSFSINNSSCPRKTNHPTLLPLDASRPRHSW